MKLKAGALQLVIVISTVIFLMLGGLMLLQYHNQRYVIRNRHLAELDRNLQAGVQLLLSETSLENGQPMRVDLYGREADSIEISRRLWGIYELGTSRSFRLRDTVSETFLIGRRLPPEDRYALYLANEDRPLSVSGKTVIRGDAYLPPAGIRKAYIEGKQYEGDEPVAGTTKVSDAELPTLDGPFIGQLQRWLIPDSIPEADTPLPLSGDSLVRSFLDPAAIIRSTQPLLLAGTALKGHVILQSDSLVTIAADAALEDVLIVAPAIVIEEGFKGRLQLFARDSLIVGRNCELEYPSALGLLGRDTAELAMELQPLMQIDSGSVVHGTIFSQAVSDVFLPEIRVAATATVVGQVHAGGWLELQGTVRGSTRCRRFKLQTPSTLYENFVLDGTMDMTALSVHYAGSPLLVSEGASRTVAKWLY